MPPANRSRGCSVQKRAPIVNVNTDSANLYQAIYSHLFLVSLLVQLFLIINTLSFSIKETWDGAETRNAVVTYLSVSCPGM